MQKTWKESFEYLSNVDAEDRDVINMCGFDDAKRGTYFGKKLVRIEREFILYSETTG